MTTIKAGDMTINTDHITQTRWNAEDGELTIQTPGYSIRLGGAEALAARSYILGSAVDVMAPTAPAVDDEPSRDLVALARAAIDMIDDGDLDGAVEMLRTLERGRAILPRRFREAAQHLIGEVLYRQDLAKASDHAERLLDMLKDRND